MSLNPTLLATKEPFTFAKFVKSVPYKPFRSKRVFTPKVQEKSKQTPLNKMGNSNLKRIPPVKLTSSPEDQQYVKRSLQRLRNGQREVHKNLWRAEKRALSSDPIVQSKDVNTNNDPDRPKIPKRATYRKGRAVHSREIRHTVPNGTYNKDAPSSDTNSESVFSSLPSRSDILPPDGGSLRSDIEKNIAPSDGPVKCASCSDAQLRLSKAYAQKGAIAVALEKTQSDLSASQKRVKDLEHDLREVRKDHDEVMSTIKALESEMCQLQKDKALYTHELNVTRKQLTRALEQSDISDSSHVSSIYVSGSQKTLDDGLGDDVSPDEEDYDSESARQWQKMKEERDFALEELERLKEDKYRKEEELKSRLTAYADKIAELEEMWKYFERTSADIEKKIKDDVLTRCTQHCRDGNISNTSVKQSNFSKISPCKYRRENIGQSIVTSVLQKSGNGVRTFFATERHREWRIQKPFSNRAANLRIRTSQLREMHKCEFESKDMSTQTLRRDGTFTRQQPDKTKIPKRLLGHHSSLPVITDPPNPSRLQLTTNSLSRFETLQKTLRIKETEIATLKNEMSELEKEREREKEHEEIMQSTAVQDLRAENERLLQELKTVKENYVKEVVKRKKYFNLVEELKGKIRVYCRMKPKDDIYKSSSVLESPDQYTVLLKTQRSKYEFLFDGIFSAEHTQEDVFREVESLVQSTIDGYNVCIFAYGQTGSGKTYTLVGNDSQPGIGPRAFRRIFQLLRDNQAEMDFRVSACVFELYNERLIDLLQNGNEDKLKIRRDRFGLVYVQGSEVRQVQNEAQLLKLFNEACSNRHTGSTRMNPESSRSHLIVTVLIESTNKITGTVLRGKMSIVDLAGSERAGKTAAVADQLKEANSINKSLSALGDVIAALSSEQSHVPYRNNKLTLLMQDSLGSNAKTLMFVTISSSEQNVEESLNSLMYASRVKQITNSATRLADSKEVARLRSIIMKMSREESFGSPNRFHPTI